MSPLMQEGLELALYGMGTVFVFLTLLVLATMMMSKIILANTSLEALPELATARDTGIDGRRIAAISAAITRFREEHER